MSASCFTRWFSAFVLAIVASCGQNRQLSKESPVVHTDESPTSLDGITWTPQKPEFEKIASRLEQSNNPYLGTDQVASLRSLLERPGIRGKDRARLNGALSWHLLRLGETGEAVERVDSAARFFNATSEVPHEVMTELRRRRTLTYLRQAELTNCIQHHNKDCCIFPLRHGGVHDDKRAATKARDILLAQLQTQPKDLSSIWLLNLVNMAIGDYPLGVAEPFRIPRSAFASEYDIGRFVDIAAAVSVNTFNLCGGVIVEDFDSDGLLDIVTSTYDPRGPLSFYRNQSTGEFEDLSSASRLDDQLGGLNCISADYDNDGDVDIFVLRGAWLFDDGVIRNSLLRNNSDGTFTDVTREAGLALPACPTQAAVWGDFDGDGSLDLFVGNESRIEQPSHDGDYPSQLFRNNGDGTFVDIAPRAGVTNDRYAKGVTAGDYDNDGDLDLYVSNVGKNRLYRNDGNGTFIDVAVELGVAEPSGRSFATWFFDYNNDGWLDLFVAAYDASIADVAADYLERPHLGTSPCLYRNEGSGRFTNVTCDVGLDHPYLPMGANFGDLDYDGFLDFYLATGDPSYESLMPNVMLRNEGGRRFQDVTTSGGFGHLQKGHGVAFADIDNDGDQDIYHQLGGFYPGDRFHNVLFQNPGHGNHFLVIKLVGTKSNRSGIGARIRVVVQTSTGVLTLHRAVGSMSSFGGSPLREEIGLGQAKRIERVEVDWPAAGGRQIATGLELDTMIEITEGKAGFTPLEFHEIELKASEELRSLSP